MASDNDWYSDESDETYFAKKDDEFQEDIRIIEEVIDMNWKVIDKRIAEVRKMERDIIKLRREYPRA